MRKPPLGLPSEFSSLGVLFCLRKIPSSAKDTAEETEEEKRANTHKFQCKANAADPRCNVLADKGRAEETEEKKEPTRNKV